jgi:hypothetical protein
MGILYCFVFVALLATISAAILRATVFYSWQGTYYKLLMGGLLGEALGVLIAIPLHFYGPAGRIGEEGQLFAIPFLSMLFGLIVQSLLIILRYGRSRKKGQK